MSTRTNARALGAGLVLSLLAACTVLTPAGEDPFRRAEPRSRAQTTVETAKSAAPDGKVDPFTLLRTKADEIRADRAARERAERDRVARELELPRLIIDAPVAAADTSSESAASAPVGAEAEAAALNDSSAGLEITTTAVAAAAPVEQAAAQPGRATGSPDPASPWTLQLTTVVGGGDSVAPATNASGAGLTLSTSVVGEADEVIEPVEAAEPEPAAGTALVATARKRDEQPAAGHLVVACDLTNEPFAMLDENGLPTGRDVEMVETLAREMGHDVLWYRIPFDELLDAVESGSVQAVCATMGVTPERARRVAFTRPYFETEILAVVRAGAGEPKQLRDLAGLKVSAGIGTTSQAALERRAPDAVAVLENKDGMAADERLLSGEIDAAVMDGPDARDLVKLSRGRLALIPQPLATESYAIALPPRDRKALVAWNKALQAFEASGAMAKLDAKYGLVQRK